VNAGSKDGGTFAVDVYDVSWSESTSVVAVCLNFDVASESPDSDNYSNDNMVARNGSGRSWPGLCRLSQEAIWLTGTIRSREPRVYLP
jgi:hypothetical protein